MKFLLIQCDKNGIPSTDLGFAAIDAVHYHKWVRGGIADWEYDYIQVKDDDISKYLNENFLPVGDIEFMERFFHEYKGVHPKAINIPKELMTEEFLGRNVQRIKIGNLDKPIKFDEPKFVKNALKIKGASMVTDILDSLVITGERQTYMDDERFYKEFLVSDMIDIRSEWRGFVYKGELIDIRQYLGPVGSWPDIDKVKAMINAYTNSPSAYVIDVAVLESGETVLIECHNFWSVGLYGFECGERLIYMLSNAFNWELRR